MKIRSDFVTNSSSSSYVLYIKNDPEITSEIIQKYPFLKFVLMFFDRLHSGNITNDKELREYIFLNYGDVFGHHTFEETINEEKSARYIYDKYSSYLNEGYVIYMMSIDYGDTLMGDCIEELDESDICIVECLS